MKKNDLDWKLIKSIEKKVLLTGDDLSESPSNFVPDDPNFVPDDDQIRSARFIEEGDNMNEYKWLHETFGKNVFDYDKAKNIIKLHKDFKAREEYILCLAAILNKNNTLEKYRKEISDLFEIISAHAIQQYLGDHWEIFLIDQNETSGNESERTRLKNFLTKTSDPKIKENTHKFGFKNQKLTTDIIVLRRLDFRCGMLALAVECKSGRNWKNSGPVNIEAWKELGIISIPVFAVADLLGNDKMSEHQCDSNKEKGLIFDRARIIRLLATVNNSELSHIRQMIKKYKLEDEL